MRPQELTLKFLLEENIVTLIPVISRIREKAEKEYENELYLESLRLEIKNYQVEIVGTSEGNLLIKNAKEHANILQDYNFNSKVKLKNDIYILPFEEHLKELQFRLKTMKHFMDQSDKLQKTLLQISEAFRLSEIQRAMEEETKEFEEIDKDYYERMKTNQKTTNFMQYIGEEDYVKIQA